MTDPPLVDSHAHVWDRSCVFVPGARYHPDYEATIDSYLQIYVCCFEPIIPVDLAAKSALPVRLVCPT